MTKTIAEIVQDMTRALVPEKAAGLNAKVQLDFSADGSGAYVVHINDGQCEVSEGRTDQADATLMATGANYVAISEGRLDPVKAFMTGQVKVTGNLGLLLRFQQMFDRSRLSQ